ncbi:MAG TPA: hypothetical protein VGB08_01880 [Allosphingosinicella sp.]|jgi:Dyp-type peroxidase family
MREVRTLSLGPASDLVVKCGWTPGIIPADEPILPRTRLAITFRTLFELRKRAREAQEPCFADPIERLERIHSFRLAAEEDGLRLAVTYDFGWESYMRALAADTGGGPFLDLLCCHCDGYALARKTPVDLWQQWIRRNQVESHYFYSAAPLTVGDLAVLSQSERLQREQADPAAANRSLAGFCSSSAEALAEERRRERPAEARRQAIRVISAMYRLTRYWTADVERSVIPGDAVTLIRAARALIQDHYTETGSLAEYESAFRSELAWYRQPIDKPHRAEERRDWKPAEVQKGIVTSFDKAGEPITHGAAVFLAVTDAQDARKALAGLNLADEAGGAPADGIFRNLAFTHSGLKRLELAPPILASAPLAFREGAAARAASVGDVRAFHPGNWRPLRRNWAPRPEWTVELGQVDALVQLRVHSPGAPRDIEDAGHPLRAEIGKLDALPGVAVLAVEGLAPANEPGSDKDHLGFSDGLSQPELPPPELPQAQAAPEEWSDKVAPSALLVGRGEKPIDAFWRDGSFMAVRRMTIDRKKFEELLDAGSMSCGASRELIAAKMVGRDRDGIPPGRSDAGNDFTFRDDPVGAACPLDSHIRRANPRVADTPRIMRRGMSFGPRVGEQTDKERGAFFIAYCADLAEQYERVLGWVNGGNSTRIGSYLSDPLSAVPGHAERIYRFLDNDVVRRLKLPVAKHAPIGLSWSHYFFAPSLSAIRSLDERAAPEADTDAATEAELAETGRGLLARLQKAGAGADTWRALLNEPGARDQRLSEAIWAAIRAGDGILDTPVGYLVGRYDLVMEVLRDDGRRFSNRGAGERMEKTIGPFHLGLDPWTEDYRTLSEPANSALRAVPEEAAFALARLRTKERITAIVDAKPPSEFEVIVDLLGQVIEPVLADLAKAWFDVPDGAHVTEGPHDWQVDTPSPRYPGDFWSPSKHAFNPFESAETERMAVAHGQAAVAAVTNFIRATGRGALSGSVSSRMATGTASYPTDEDLARALVGCMIGGVPTVAGNAVRMLVVGLEKGELDRAQMPWLAVAERTFEHARAAFGPDMEKLLAKGPVPEVLWRIVGRDGDRLGAQPLEKGRTLIFSLESAGRDKLPAVDKYIPYGMASAGEQTPHGCPGREMANGTMLGLLVGLLESARFRPGPGRGLAALRPLA